MYCLRSGLAMLGLAALLGGAHVANAAIFASDLVVSGTAPSLTLHYVLNENAVSGSITVAAAATPGTPVKTITLAAADLTRGPHDVSFSSTGVAAGSYVFQVNVTAAPHNGYDIITPITALPTGAQVAYGTKADRAPGTIDYGHIFFSDFGTQKVQEVDAGGNLIQSINMPGSGIYVPVGLWVDANGDIYPTDQNIDRVYQYTPSGSPLKPTWTGVGDYRGAWSDETTNDGSFYTRNIQLFGMGPTARVYMTNYSPVPNQVTMATLNDTANTPAVLFDGANIAGTRIDNLLVTSDEKTIYITSGAAGTVHLNKYTYDSGSSSWVLDPTFVENNQDPANPAQLVQRARGILWAPDGKNLLVTQSFQDPDKTNYAANNYIAVVSTSTQPTSPGPAIQAMRVAGGLDFVSDISALDTNADYKVDLIDAVNLVRKPSPPGSIMQRIPVPTTGSPALPVQPVNLDYDAKGNLVVAANITDGSAITANGFYVMAFPDNGSSDTATSAAFPIS